MPRPPYRPRNNDGTHGRGCRVRIVADLDFPFAQPGYIYVKGQAIVKP